MSERYAVKAGDSLWKIAEVTLGDGHQWKRLWRYNNRAEVVKVTGRGIPNADLIYPGQVLLLPAIPAAPGTAEPMGPPAPNPPGATGVSGQPLRVSSPSPAPSGSALPPVDKLTSPIAFKYRLDDLKFPPAIQPGGIVEIKMSGDVILTTMKTYPATYVTSKREIESQVVTAANHAFGSLLSDTRLIYDAPGNKLTYRSMLVTQSNVPGAMSTAVGVVFDTQNPIPKLRFEFRFAKIEGRIADFAYTGLDVKVVIELTPKADRRTPSAQPLRSPQPVRATQPGIQWDYVIGAGLVVAAGVIVVATLVEDFFTAGAGIADDPASFAAAAASVARGLQLMRGAVLPLAAVPVTLNLSMKLENKNASGAVVRPRL